MIIAVLCILATTLLFLTIAFVAVYLGIIRPMQEQLAAREEVEAISQRTEELRMQSNVRHLDVREDVVRLHRRLSDVETKVSDLEDSFCARTTRDMSPSVST